MNNQPQPGTPLTFEALMASIHESNRFLTEQLAETRRDLKEQSAETDRRRKENEHILKENWEKYEKRMKRMEKDMGSWSNNHGAFAEEYFFNSLEDGQLNFFGEQFDEIEKNLKPKLMKVNEMKIKCDEHLKTF